MRSSAKVDAKQVDSEGRGSRIGRKRGRQRRARGRGRGSGFTAAQLRGSRRQPAPMPAPRKDSEDALDRYKKWEGGDPRANHQGPQAIASQAMPEVSLRLLGTQPVYWLPC